MGGGNTKSSDASVKPTGTNVGPVAAAHTKSNEPANNTKTPQVRTKATLDDVKQRPQAVFDECIPALIINVRNTTGISDVDGVVSTLKEYLDTKAYAPLLQSAAFRTQDLARSSVSR